MPIQRPLRARRGAADYALYAEAFAALAAASMLIALKPFKKIAAAAARPPRRARAADPAAIAKARAAVRAWARRVPWRTLCFEQALALQMMLRRRGVASTLHYGIAHRAGLKAHVWLSVGGETVIGGEQAPLYEEVARFGPGVPAGRTT